MNDATLKAVIAAARYNCSAAADPPEGFPPILAAAIQAGTLTAMAVLAAALVEATGVDYDAMLKEFGIPQDKAPPKEDIMRQIPKIVAEYAKRAEATH